MKKVILVLALMLLVLPVSARITCHKYPVRRICEVRWYRAPGGMINQHILYCYTEYVMICAPESELEP